MDPVCANATDENINVAAINNTYFFIRFTFYKKLNSVDGGGEFVPTTITGIRT
jgi:hypothetical protein